MASLWVDLRCGPVGLYGSLLQEYHTLYRLLADHPREQPEMIMMVRGPKRIPSCPPYLGSQIHVRRIGQPLFLVAECGLHLLPEMAKAKAGEPRNSTLRLIRGTGSWSPGQIAWRLYARLLSLFSNVIIFFAEEFGGVAQVVFELATWAHTAGPDMGHRPHVLVFTDPGGWASRRLQQELTVEILSRFNPGRELSFRSAEAAWKGCFDGVEIVNLPCSQSELHKQLRQVSSRVPRLEFAAAQYRPGIQNPRATPESATITFGAVVML